MRAALEYVARGEAPLGIVYRTDALAEKRVRVVDVFPADSHPPIIYPLALTAGAGRGRGALRGVSHERRRAGNLVGRGFVMLPPPRAP